MDYKELFRKSLHAAMGVGLAALIYYNIIDGLLLFKIIIMAGILSFLATKMYIPLLTEFLDRFERKEDRWTFPGRGPILMLVGSLIVLKMFTKDIALAATLPPMSILALRLPEV